MPFLNTRPLNKSTMKFHFSFQVSPLEKLRSVISMSWSMSATFAPTRWAADTAVNISAPGLTPTLAPSFFSAQAPMRAKRYPLRPMCL